MRRTARPADDLVTEWFASLTAATPAPPAAPADGPGADGGEGSPVDAAIDTQVTQGLTKLQADVKALLDLQAKDPGVTAGDAPDAKVQAGLEQLDALLDTVVKSQDTDNAANPAPAGGDAEPDDGAVPPPAAASSGASYWASMPKDERDKAAKSGAAMPDGSYPITSCDGDNSVDTAIHAVGRGGADHDAIRAHIIKRAKSLGCASKIPDNWNADGSLKGAQASMAVPPGPDAKAGPTQGPDPDTDTRPGNPPTGPVDPTVACADCGHMASGHLDDPAVGPNVGPCQMEGCVCQGMRVPDGDPVGSGPPFPQGGDPHSARTQAFDSDVLDPTTQTPGANGSPSDPAANTGSDPTDGAGTVNDGGPSLAIPTGAINGPAFTIPVLIIEGITTSDGRMVQPGALTWRNPPLPLMGLRETTDLGHTGAVICGRIDKVWRDGNNLSASGFFDTSDDGLEFARLVEEQMIIGVSADIADTTSEVTVTEIGEDGFPTAVADTITTGELMGATVCPFPAFAGAYIVIGDGTDTDAPIPQTPTPEQAASGIHVLSTKACAPCEAGALVASSVPLAPPAEWFTDPELDAPTKLTVDSDGRVFGHLAAWGTCHIAAGGGRCVTPPRGNEYSFFRTGYVVTADGSEVATGPITVDTGHASTDPRVTAAAALAHYDNTGHAVADVAIGEDEHGIWLAGAIRPTASDEQVHLLRASAVSGDWRPVGRGMELVAALAVNRPGFPITKAVTHDGELTSLVAAGMVIDVDTAQPVLDDATRLARLEATFAAVAPLAVASVRDRFDAMR
jgi:hypothetical protein